VGTTRWNNFHSPSGTRRSTIAITPGSLLIEPVETISKGDGDLTDPFSPGVGLDLFEASHARLASLGLRVPEVHLVDRDRTHYPADLAIVEDFPGEDLMDLFNRDPRAAEPTMARLADALAAMRRHRAPSFGKVAQIDKGGRSRASSCEEAALEFALRCLAEAASRNRRIADAHGRLEERLRELAAAVRPRAEYSVVHGELGLDHVLVDRDGNPVVIDFEELLYFDVEWEHVFLRLRQAVDLVVAARADLDDPQQVSEVTARCEADTRALIAETCRRRGGDAAWAAYAAPEVAEQLRDQRLAAAVRRLLASEDAEAEADAAHETSLRQRPRDHRAAAAAADEARRRTAEYLLRTRVGQLKVLRARLAAGRSHRWAA
jgi:hypothetical protein